MRWRGSRIGSALLTAGAYDAAQLDVNSTYPRFMLVAHGAADQGLDALALTDPLIPDLHYRPTEYVATAESRDFFYIKRKTPSSPGALIESSLSPAR